MELSKEVRIFAVALQIVALLLGIGVCFEGFASHTTAMELSAIAHIAR
jgi:hypothetical protein